MALHDYRTTGLQDYRRKPELLWHSTPLSGPSRSPKVTGRRQKGAGSGVTTSVAQFRNYVLYLQRWIAWIGHYWILVMWRSSFNQCSVAKLIGTCAKSCYNAWDGTLLWLEAGRWSVRRCGCEEVWTRRGKKLASLVTSAAWCRARALTDSTGGRYGARFYTGKRQRYRNLGRRERGQQPSAHRAHPRHCRLWICLGQQWSGSAADSGYLPGRHGAAGFVY